VQLVALIEPPVAPLPLNGRLLTDRNRLPPSSALDFEALIHTEKRYCSLGLTAPQLAPLFRLPSPPGTSPFPPWASAYPKPSALDVTGQSLRSRDDLSQPPSASSGREDGLVCLQTADLLETFEPSAQPRLIG